MYYIANFSVVTMEDASVFVAEESEVNACDLFNENNQPCRETVFCQADLWKVHRQMRTIHVTDRFPRTWEGL
jgi:hypothetical protein